MVVDNFPSLPESDYSMFDLHSLLDCYRDDEAFYLVMDPFYTEVEKEEIHAASVDSSTSSAHLPVPAQDISSSNHLQALSQCVQNMISPVNFLHEGYVVEHLLLFPKYLVS